MRELSLFTGAGGGLLGTVHLLGWQPVGMVEWDDYCCKVLEQRMRDGVLPYSPIWQMDIREFNRRVAERYAGMVDVITAGFPCQPFSVAGQRRGADDERNMWPATINCIRRVRPQWCLLENVPGLLARSHGYFGQILGDLAESGYDAQWRCLSAAEVGASHKRNRLFILASNTNSERELQPEGCVTNKRGWVCDSIQKEVWTLSQDNGIRAGNGIPNKVERTRAIGNGQFPAVVAAAWTLLTENE